MKILKSAACALIATGMTAPAWGSHHFETELSQAYPAYDLTDLFVFDGEPGKTVFIIDINPKTKDDGKAAFGDQGLYNIHISTDRELSGGMTLTFRYSNGNMVIGKIDQPNPALGVEGSQLGSGQVGKTTRFSNGMRLWAGGAKDPFVGNAAGIRKFRDALRQGEFNEHAFDNAEDFFGKLFTSAIVLEVPNKLLPKQINVFATSAMRLDGRWMQVNRLANVLETHLFFLSDPTVALDHVMHRPDDDNQRKLWMSSLVARATMLAGTKTDPVAYGDEIAERLLPDMMPYKVGTKARYGVESANGRRTTDDSMDVMLTIFAGKPFSDQANVFDHHPQTFPYVVPTTAGGDRQ